MDRVLIGIILLSVGIVIGAGIGGTYEHNKWKSKCKAANVKIVEHESLVNGYCVSNWVECVQLK